VTRQHLADALGLSLVHTEKTRSSLPGLFTGANGRLALVNPRLTERLARSCEREWQTRPLL
jgi:hypothetical protein